MPAKDRETRRRLHANWRAKQYEQGRRQITLWADGPERELLETTLKRHRDGGAQIDLEDAIAAAPPDFEELSDDELRELRRSLVERELGIWGEMGKRRNWNPKAAFFTDGELRTAWPDKWREWRHEDSKGLKDYYLQEIEGMRLEFAARGLDVEDPPPE